MTSPSTGVRIVELAIDTASVCLAERRDVLNPLGMCVLVHDQHGDLDRMRQFVGALDRYSLSSLLIDLPGHGLSSGDAAKDSVAAVEAVLFYAHAAVQPVTVIVDGASTDTLLRVYPPESLAAYVMLAPRSDMPDEDFCQTAWSRIPSISILDPHDEAADRVAGMVARNTRAVAGRVFAHKAAVLGSGRAAWPIQSAQSAASFLAEHATFWRSANKPMTGKEIQ
ncbi:MAG: hypothetical protein Q7V58_02615 [Actinomycetota bacterium]|nr:hypothetical protein [Actinomycetota bacterium]